MEGKRRTLRRSLRQPQSSTSGGGARGRKIYTDFPSESEEEVDNDVKGKRGRPRKQRGLGGDHGGEESLKSSRYYKWCGQSEVVISQLAGLFGEGGDLRLTTDVTLVSSEGDLVEAHKVVLVLCSGYFRKLFGKLTRSVAKEPTVVVLANVKSRNLKNLVKFMYTGEVDVAQEEEPEFLKIGQFLGLTGIQPSEVSEPRSTDKSEKSVIKVKVITSTEEDDEVNVEEGDVVRCKVETCEEDDFQMEDHSMEMDDHFNDDDGGANFSDQRARGDNEEEYSEGPSIDPVTGKLPHRGKWYPMPTPTEEDLEENWRLNQQKQLMDGETCRYYCYHGGKCCGARIKKLVEDGVTTWVTNRVPHSNHRQKPFGLPKETKRFVISMLEQGIRRPEKILKAMRLLQMDLPTRRQVENCVNFQVKTRGHEFPLPEKKPPSRVRKYVPKNPPKKRGRPKVTVKSPRLNVHGFPCESQKKLKQSEVGESEGQTSNPTKEEPIAPNLSSSCQNFSSENSAPQSQSQENHGLTVTTDKSETTNLNYSHENDPPPNSYTNF